MINGFGRSLFVLSAAALLSVSTVRAQDDAKQLFEEGVRLLRQNQDADALEKFKAAIAANPSMEDAYRIWKQTESRVWAAMMANDDLAKVARSFLELAQRERKRASADAGAIKPLVAKALSAKYEERSAANLELMSNHGEYAVPFLLGALGNPDEDDAQTYAILCCDQLGRAATLPLVAALSSDKALLRRNIAAALLYIGDARALPALKRLAEKDEDASVREVAQRAMVKIGGSGLGSSSDLYLDQSRRYLAGDPTLLQDGDIQDGLWSFVDGKLVHRKVPAALFGLELAKDAAYGALEVNPNSEDGLVALTRAYAAEGAVVAAAGDDGDLAGLESAVGEMDITVLAAGPKVMRRAFDENVRDHMVPAAAQTLRTLARLENPKDLAGSPLIAALSNNDKRLRYGAAVALADMNANLDAAQRGAVVSALGQAVLEQSRRIVTVIDPNKANRDIAEATSSDSDGTVVVAEARATRALADIAKFPPDVIVVAEQLDTLLVEDVLRFCADRPRLANTKIILVTKDKDGAAETYGDKVHGYIQGPLTGVALKNRINEVLAGVPADAARSQADKIAASAAEAMARLDPASYPVANASAQLARAATRGENVAVNALNALGGSAAASDLAAVIAIANGSKAKPKICAAAARALGSIMARTGNADQASVDALVALAADKALDSSIRSAAVAALGRAPILAGMRAKLLRDLRVNASTGGDEGN